jgi:hypothetical protein
MNLLPATDFTSRTPEGVADTYVAALRARGFSGDKFLGDGGTIVIVIGPEHRRYFLEAGWSKADLQSYVHPRVAAADQPGRPVKVQPEGLMFVAAGGAGMAEAWVIFPHLAWAITEPVVVGLPPSHVNGSPGGGA